MIQKLQLYIDRSYKYEISRQEAEYRALQSQINPHFLYNTLDSINWLAKRSGQKDISTMVEALSHLMRYSISKTTHPPLPFARRLIL